MFFDNQKQLLVSVFAKKFPNTFSRDFLPKVLLFSNDCFPKYKKVAPKLLHRIIIVIADPHKSSLMMKMFSGRTIFGTIAIKNDISTFLRILLFFHL